MLTIFRKRGSLNHLSLTNFPTFSGSKKFQLIGLETHVSTASSQWYRRSSTDSGSMVCLSTCDEYRLMAYLRPRNTLPIPARSAGKGQGLRPTRAQAYDDSAEGAAKAMPCLCLRLLLVIYSAGSFRGLFSISNVPRSTSQLPVLP